MLTRHRDVVSLRITDARCARLAPGAAIAGACLALRAAAVAASDDHHGAAATVVLADPGRDIAPTQTP
jgi:hypothetical protein